VSSAPGVDPAGGDVSLRKVTHKIVHECAQAVESYRFNVVVARVMELVNATRKAIDTGCGPADPAVREAAEAAAIILSLVAPYTAEDMWERLGHTPSVMRASWPQVDPALLVADAVTCVIQINGKLRDNFEVSPDISEAELQEIAMARPAVQTALAGGELKRVIVRAPKLVNVVIA
jgi:leucyl-tRNA synthetase